MLFRITQETWFSRCWGVGWGNANSVSLWSKDFIIRGSWTLKGLWMATTKHAPGSLMRGNHEGCLRLQKLELSQQMDPKWLLLPVASRSPASWSGDLTLDFLLLWVADHCGGILCLRKSHCHSGDALWGLSTDFAYVLIQSQVPSSDRGEGGQSLIS